MHLMRLCLKNPVRGWQFGEGRTLQNTFLFVFRRLEMSETEKPTTGLRAIRVVQTAEPAPPKNKKENGHIGARFYKQATPNGVWTPNCIPKSVCQTSLGFP